MFLPSKYAASPQPLQKVLEGPMTLRVVILRSTTPLHGGSPAAPAPRAATRRRAADQRDELAPFHRPMPPVLPTERIAHLYGRRLLRCGISIRPVGWGSNPDLSASSRMASSASCGHDAALALGTNVPEPAVSSRSRAAPYSIILSARGAVSLDPERPYALLGGRLILED